MGPCTLSSAEPTIKTARKKPMQRREGFVCQSPLKKSLTRLDCKPEVKCRLHLKNIIFPFLTRELRMRNTSYRELWENVSLDQM